MFSFISTEHDNLCSEVLTEAVSASALIANTRQTLHDFLNVDKS